MDSTPGIRRGSSHPAPNRQGRPRFPDPAESALNRTRKSASHAAEYLTEGVVLAVPAGLLAYAAEDRRIKADILTWALLLTMLVAFSRVYLGVHWSTDVIAGWVAGST